MPFSFWLKTALYINYFILVLWPTLLLMTCLLLRLLFVTSHCMEDFPSFLLLLQTKTGIMLCRNMIMWWLCRSLSLITLISDWARKTKWYSMLQRHNYFIFSQPFSRLLFNTIFFSLTKSGDQSSNAVPIP